MVYLVISAAKIHLKVHKTQYDIKQTGEKVITYLQFFVIFRLRKHLDLYCIYLQQLCAFLLVICTIFFLTRFVELFQNLIKCTSYWQENLHSDTTMTDANLKKNNTLLIRPYSPMSNQILQSFRFVLNHNLCKKKVTMKPLTRT